jgi:predicted nucleic acid-binding protein
VSAADLRKFRVATSAAASVAAAERYGCAPVTADQKLARASGVDCAVELIA